MVWVSAKETLEFGLGFGARVWIAIPISNPNYTSTPTKNISDYRILGFTKPRIIESSDLRTLEFTIRHPASIQDQTKFIISISSGGIHYGKTWELFFSKPFKNVRHAINN